MLVAFISAEAASPVILMLCKPYQCLILMNHLELALNFWSFSSSSFSSLMRISLSLNLALVIYPLCLQLCHSLHHWCLVCKHHVEETTVTAKALAWISSILALIAVYTLLQAHSVHNNSSLPYQSKKKLSFSPPWSFLFFFCEIRWRKFRFHIRIEVVYNCRIL